MNRLIYTSCGPRLWRSRLKRSPRMWKVGCTNLTDDRPKSLNKVMTVPLSNTRQQVFCHGSSETTIINWCMCNTPKNPHCSMAMSAEYRKKWPQLINQRKETFEVWLLIAGLVCPSCDASLNCVFNSTCDSSETCMIRAHQNSQFTVHCSKVVHPG